MNTNNKGIALILFGILVSLGTIAELYFCWLIGLAIGLAGLVLVFIDRGGKKL